MQVNNTALKSLAESVTLVVEGLKISYSTAHYNGILFSGSLGDDLLDGTEIPIPETPDEKRIPRREDRYLAAKAY